MNDAQSSNAKRRPALVATAPIAWRSHSAPPRKKWYRRGPQLLNRQRSTTQQSGSMLYDQMVARRLVGAIAAWHDLHASLLQLSLRATDDDVGVEMRRRAKRGGSRVSSRASSICSSVAGHGRKKASVRRVTSRTASGRRQCQRQISARRSGRNRLRVSNSRGPSPRSSFSAGSARSSSIADGGVGCGAASGSPRRCSPRSPSRSSSGASGGSSSGAENHRGALTVTGGGPSTSSSQLLPCWRHRHDLSPHDFGFSNSSPSSSLAVAAAEPRPTAATWSATFAQSLQIRRPPAAAVAGGSRKTARSSSNCDGEQIVLKHHVKLLDPVVSYPPVQHQCARCCLLPPSPQPMLLSPPSTISHHYCQRRCFSVSKVDLDVPTSSSSMLGDELRGVHQRRRHHRHRCSCGEEEGDETADDEHDDDGGEEAAEDGEDELEDSASSDGAVSDTELDALVADEKHRPKLSLAEEPELSPEQLRQLFPELSEHWRSNGRRDELLSFVGRRLKLSTVCASVMLQSLARFKKSSTDNDRKDTQKQPMDLSSSTKPADSPPSLTSSTTIGLIGAEQSEAYDTIPNCSTTIAKATNGVVVNKKRLKLNCGSTKLKQSWECQERQSPIIEDSVMDAFVEQQLPSTSCSIHSRTTPPNFSFEPDVFRQTVALCSSPHSSATSPGGSSSTLSHRSFHVRLPDAVANLRKSGVHLVRNFRRSSLAAMMRAMTISSAGHDQNASSAGSKVNGGMVEDRPPLYGGIKCPRHANDGTGAAGPFRCRTTTGISTHHWTATTAAVVESVPASTDESSRHSTMTCGGTQRRKRSGGPGSGARRAMRKRISAARLALRKISRISTQSGSTIATVASSSSTHSSPKTPVSVHGYCGGNSPVWQSLNSNSTEHPLKKCLSRQLLEADEQNNNNTNNKAVNDNDETEQQQQLVPMNGTGRNGVGAISWNGDEHHHQRQRHGDNDDEVENNRSKKLRKRSRTLAVAKELLFVKSDKKPLGPSLSWDPQQRQQHQKPSRSRTPLSALDGTNPRDRIHSDGSAEQLVHMRNSKSAILLAGKNVPSTKGRGGGHFEKKSKGKRRKKSGTLLSGAERVEKVGLDLNCLHCALQAEHCASTLRSEIECAVKRLAIRLNSGGGDDGAAGCRALSPTATCRKRAATTTVVRVEVETERQQLVQQQQQLRRTIGTPDIVISSYNSEDTPAESADEGFWTTSSATVKGVKQQQQHQNQQKDNKLGSHSSSNEMDKGHSTESQLANAETNDQQLPYGVWSPMDTLKPPGGAPFGGSNTLYSSGSSASGSVAFIPSGHSLPGGMPSLDAVVGDHLNTPPRSNSVDLSLLRRDIERWSVSNLSIAGSTTDLEMVELKNNRGTGVSTPGGDSMRTVRSRSYDPTSSPDFILRRPSRIEHLSEIFRRALAKSPVVKRAAVMQEQELKRVSKHRTSRYWLEDQLGPSEHIWLTSSASASSTVDTECYLGEKDCQKMGEKRRCSGCHIVAHTACFPLLAKMNLSCKTTFRDCAVVNAPGAKSPSPAGTKRQRQSNKGELCSSSNNNELNNNNNNNNYKHHWVHRWRLEGRCSHCGKSFQQKMFREKEVIAITCSWCKRSYHNKRHCFSLARFDDHCDRGVLRELILPPGWLLRLPVARKRSANASGVTRALSVLDSVQQKRSKRCKYRTFVVKPPPASAATSPQAQNMANTYSRWSTAAQQLPLPIQPLLVFVNPKSGGNKGAKALNMLCWLLNPRQVFDINVMRGPKYGLDMFRKVHSSMRILVCGGDGTVGWVLSTLDLLGWPAYPPIALLPLGTGNDLSRAMGWGGTFSSDEPLAEVLAAVQTETSVTHLDRWRIDVCPLATTTTTTIAGGAVCNGTETENNAGGLNNNQNDNNNNNNNDFKMDQQQQQATETSAAGPATSTSSSDGAQAVPGPAEEAAVQSQLPLSVMNNYFSIGADAHVALQFHQSRSANPQMLNSRLKNRIAYGGLGTIDLFKRTWKDLSEYISVECDGVDISAKIREFKFHCVLFHNIAFYAGGTVPWGAGDGVHESCGEVFSRPSPCDGKIEVLGFTTATLAALQMGGKGERIAQCSKVRIETSKPIPMQVDGEPCLLGPSLIHLTFHNKVSMLRREKFARPPGTAPCNNIVSMGQNRRKSSQNSSANSSIAGGAGGGAVQASTTMMTTAGANGNGTVQSGGHKNSRANASPEGPSSASPLTVTAASPPTTMLLDVPVIVVGRHDYDTYRDSVERLKDTGFELGILNVEAETELAQLRQHIQQMMCEHQILPYDPGPEWRFLDYVSSAEEGTFRVSRHQEQCRTVADVCSLEQVECRPGILILDDAFPSMNARAAAIGHELVFTLARKAAAPTTTSDRRNTMIRRRISETLRIVLANDAPETHL
uniref:Diacylglycerol kinase n=1 Tax=Globodera rostochiensis TaxID=31243 RepID=A0A914HIS9_GLORO